ncbi:MAG: hypothetical protein J0M25_14535 [Flavobacteriales bacterium]|nr:hypothetical protein [Flavobacteriales bacterium]
MKNVVDYIELTIENVDLNSTIEYLFEVISEFTLKNRSELTREGDIDFQSLETLKSSIVNSSDDAFYFYVLDVRILNTTLNMIGLQIIKYNAMYDLNIDFQESELKEKMSVTDLQHFASLLTTRLKGSHYYCGLEPAYVEDTRLFTGNFFGPLLF